MKFQKILFPTDFSTAGEAALKFATALARDSGALLVIAHVEEMPMPFIGGEMYFAQVEYPNPEIRRMLEAVVPPDPNVRCEHRLVMGIAADDIVRLANEEQADLIVLGTHGRTGLRRVLMGSVAESVMRLATCPVLIVKEGSKTPVSRRGPNSSSRVLGKESVMKVLIAVDGSAGSFEAANQVGKFLSPGADDVALFYTPPNVRASKATDPELQARTREALAQVIFDEVRKRLPADLQAKVHAIVGTQDPRVGIVQSAEKWGADLIALGARGLSLLDRLLLGSVSRAVVNGSKVPVWVARASTLPPHPTMNLLIACESPELGRPGAELLGRLTWPSGVTCRTLTVFSKMFAGRVPDWVQRQTRSPDVEAMVQAWAHEHEEGVRGNVERMKQFCHELPTPCHDCQSLVVEGEPDTEILATITREKIDLVVMGIKRKRAFTLAILGSTSEAVLNHAPCSVLLVPQP